MEVYVIYKDGELYHPTGRKTVYLKTSGARQVVTMGSEYDARNNNDYDYYVCSKKDREKLHQEAKSHYEIRIYKDSGETLKIK